MAEIIGKIGDLTVKGVEVIKLRYQELIKALREGSLEDLYEPPLPERALDIFLGPRLTLKFAPEAINSLVEHAGNFCRITVKDGAIVNVAPFKNEHEILEEAKSLLLKREGTGSERFLGQPLSLRDGSIAIMSLIDEMQAERGMVERSKVKEEAKRRYGIGEEKAEKIICHMLRDGIVYEPRKGFLKKL